MGQPTLDERFRKGAPKRADNESHGWMTANERRFILWGLKEGWSAARIGRGLGVNDATVRRFRTKFAKDPGLIFKLGTFEIYGRAKSGEYRCLVCGDHVSGRVEIERHVLRHFLDESNVNELLPREASASAVSAPAVDAPRTTAVRDRADASSVVISEVENADEALDVLTASSDSHDQPQDFERLVAQIGADGTFEEVLKRALGEVSRQRSQREQDIQPDPASNIRVEAPETGRRETLTLTQLRARHEARLREPEAGQAGDESRQDDGSEASGAVPDDAGQVISLPSSLRDEVETSASTPVDSGQSQGDLTDRRDLSEGIGEQDLDPTETEMMRLAFERLKAKAAEQTGEPPVSGPQSEESEMPAQRGEQTTIDGEMAPGRQSDTPSEQSQPIGEGVGPSSDPGEAPSEIEIRRAAYERLRAQAAEQDAISSPPGRSVKDDESTRARLELESVLGEPVSPPQESPDDTQKPSPLIQLRGESRGEPSSGLDVPPTEAEIRRAAFERLRAQAAEDEELATPQSKGRGGQDERSSKIREVENLITERAKPWTSDTGSESVIGRETFQRAREQVEEENAPTPKPSSGASAARGEGAQAPGSPISFGPGSEAGENDLDTSDWHAAFERLAAQRGEAAQEPGDEDAVEQTPPHQDASESGPPERRHDFDADPDLPSQRQAFERLSPQQRAGDDAAEGEGQAGGDGPADASVSETTQPLSAESTQGASRSEEFDELRRMAEEENATEADSTPRRHESETDARSAEFERMRREALDRNAMPMPPGSPAVTPGNVKQGDEFERPQQAAATPEISETAPGLGPDDPLAPPDPETGPAPAEDSVGMGIDGQEAPWEIQQDAEEEAGESAGPGGAGRSVKGPRLGRFLQLGSRFARGASIRSAAGRGRDMLARISVAAPKETTALTIEHGYVKLLVTRGREVVDYRIVPASPRFFREGLVSDAPRITGLLKQAVQDLNGRHKRVIAAVPGYQTNLRRIEVPNVKGMDPKVVIPNEARRIMGISTGKSRITWHHLPGTAEMSSWLVVSATNRSISSISAPATGAGLAMTAVELRPFAVARATNQADAIFAWTAADGCDAVIVRDWVPMTYQSAYWGAGLAMESTDLVNRIVEVVESTIDAHDIQNPEMVASRDIPMYVYGSPSGKDNDIAPRVAQLLGRETAEPDIPLDLPAGFPLDDLIVNVGLSLWDD